MKRAGVLIDVAAIRADVEQRDFCGAICIEAAEDLWGDGSSCAIGAIDDDPLLAEFQVGHAIEQELNVVGLKSGIIFDGWQRSWIGRVIASGVMEDFLLHGQFYCVGQLEAVRSEELDAVVAPGIVGSGDDDAGLKSMRVGEEGDGGSGHDASGFDAGSGGAEAGSERGG